MVAVGLNQIVGRGHETISKSWPLVSPNLTSGRTWWQRIHIWLHKLERWRQHLTILLSPPPSPDSLQDSFIDGLTSNVDLCWQGDSNKILA